MMKVYFYNDLKGQSLFLIFSMKGFTKKIFQRPLAWIGSRGKQMLVACLSISHRQSGHISCERRPPGSVSAKVSPEPIVLSDCPGSIVTILPPMSPRL